MVKIVFSSRCAVSALVALGAMLAATRAVAAPSTGTSKVTMLSAATLNRTQDLDFGTIIRGTAASRVTINARTGARTRTGTAILVGGTVSRAQFSGSATAGRIVTLSLGAPAITLTNSAGAGTMTVNTFRISVGGAAQQTLPRNVTMPASGTLALSVGGRLNLAALQAGGSYSGNFTLNMNYQ